MKSSVLDQRPETNLIPDVLDYIANNFFLTFKIEKLKRKPMDIV